MALASFPCLPILMLPRAFHPYNPFSSPYCPGVEPHRNPFPTKLGSFLSFFPFFFFFFFLSCDGEWRRRNGAASPLSLFLAKITHLSPFYALFALIYNSFLELKNDLEMAFFFLSYGVMEHETSRAYFGAGPHLVFMYNTQLPYNEFTDAQG